jgi:hypothetical protein
LLGYIGEILTQQHKLPGLPLAPVLSFVLHQSPEHWNISTAFEDLRKRSTEPRYPTTVDPEEIIGIVHSSYGRNYPQKRGVSSIRMSA